jgi:hypothetical protein
MNKLKFNTKKELSMWLKGAHLIDYITDEYDESGNYWTEVVYQKDDKYYAVSYLDGIPSPERPKKIGEGDWYEIYEVKKIKKMVEIIEWESIN